MRGPFLRLELADVVEAFDARLLLRTAKGENHKVAVSDLPPRSQIPSSVDEIRLSERADRRQILVSLEANEMDAAPHLSLRTSPRYIGPMAKTLYRVSIRQVDKDGHIITIHVDTSPTGDLTSPFKR